MTKNKNEITLERAIHTIGFLRNKFLMMQDKVSKRDHYNKLDKSLKRDPKDTELGKVSEYINKEALILKKYDNVFSKDEQNLLAFLSNTHDFTYDSKGAAPTLVDHGTHITFDTPCVIGNQHRMKIDQAIMGKDHIKKISFSDAFSVFKSTMNVLTSMHKNQSGPQKERVGKIIKTCAKAKAPLSEENLRKHINDLAKGFLSSGTISPRLIQLGKNTIDTHKALSVVTPEM